MSTSDTIRQNAERADQLIAQLAAPADSAASPDAGEAAGAADAPADQTAPAEPAAAAPAAPVTAAPAVSQTPAGDTPSSDENSETFAQRWRSLQGVHSSLQHKLRESEAARQNLEQLMAQMQAAPRTAPAPRAAHLSDKDQTEYGAEMVDFVRRAARDEVAPFAQALQGIIAQVNALRRTASVVDTLATAQVATTRDAFYADLTRSVPNWRTVNDSPDFHKWLLENDAFTGLQRDTLLKDAHENLDLGRVVSIFRGFAQGVAGSAPAPAAVTSVAPAAAPLDARARLERQVAPGRASAGSAPPQAVQKKQWSHADIAQFYADKRNGKYRGREKEADATERDIFDAQREGRVVLSAA